MLGTRIASSLNRRSYERWAWDSWKRMSAAFLHSPPDPLGHIGNEEFQVAFAAFGQAIVGSTTCFKPSCMQSMMKLGGIYWLASEKEAVNFLLRKVPAIHIERYINHLSGHPSARRAPIAMVPDIHVPNYPTGRQSVNDSGSIHSSTSIAEAILEVNTGM
ncbi:hypothetical protein THAOC_21108 [Thalassiosira oceanica]|uniref:Uncharacterized protein n=1 Tax=Thalassiosira oceanica TaxID=159749 RepID=K0S1U9_THAOC|nr:hypothetical protein THAOC_21108 [Thalassiosira oceanica]|eukprot:EJK58739.1 hypothetical protein THAOC_21108 [Thalassiosira oceanica]